MAAHTFARWVLTNRFLGFVDESSVPLLLVLSLYRSYIKRLLTSLFVRTSSGISKVPCCGSLLKTMMSFSQSPMSTAFWAYKSYSLTSTHAIPNGRSTPILTTANNHYHYYYNNNSTRTSGRTYNIVCCQNKENAGSYESLSAVLTQSNGITSTDMVVESGTRTIPTTTTTIPLMKPCDGIGIVSYLKGKNYLITGATGFLAKGIAFLHVLCLMFHKSITLIWLYFLE
jgi:hypothetical protein